MKPKANATAMPEQVVGHERNAQIIKLVSALKYENDALAKALASGPTASQSSAAANSDAGENLASPSSPPPQVFKIDYRDACQACGTENSLFNAELVRQAIMACARPGEVDFDDKAPFVVEAMRLIAPRNTLEALRASLAVAAHQAAMTSYRAARSCSGDLASVFSARGDRAAVVADALIEAIERGRGKCAQEVIAPTRREQGSAK
jgi:hypothetical protein